MFSNNNINSGSCDGVFVVIFFKNMYNKTIIRSRFCDILNNQGFGKCYQPRPLAWLITLTLTLIIPDITKTSVNNCLLLTHSHLNCLQFSAHFSMKFGLVGACLAKEMKIVKEKLHEQGREKASGLSQRAVSFLNPKLHVRMRTLIPPDASIASVSHLRCLLSSGLHCISRFCLQHMPMLKELIFRIRSRSQHMWFSFINSLLGSFGAYKPDSDQKTAFLWLASNRHFQHNFRSTNGLSLLIFLKECIQTVLWGNKNWIERCQWKRGSKCLLIN